MTAPQPLSAAERAYLVAHHADGGCYKCRWFGVCPEARLLATVDALAAERDAMKQRADELWEEAEKHARTCERTERLAGDYHRKWRDTEARAEAAELEAAGLRAALIVTRPYMHTLAGLDTMGRGRTLVIERLPGVAASLLVKIDAALAATQQVQEGCDA